MFQIIRGTFQGDPWIFPPESVGKHCVPNCVMAIAYSLTFPIHRWQSEHLDCILISGNNLHAKIASTHDYLLPSDIPEHFSEFGADFMINTEKELFGTWHNNTNIRGTDLIDALSSVFTQDSWTHGILCLGPASSAYACAIFVQANHCYIFDPHCRDKVGMSMDPGTSVLLHFTDIETCCLNITEVAERMDSNQYDLTIIKIRYCQEHYLHDQQQIDN